MNDQLGGVNHFAALLKSDAVAARLVLGAGPMLFQNPALDPKEKDQDLIKARALGDVLAGIGMGGWAPGANDFAGGAELLDGVTHGRLTLFASNVAGGGFSATRVFEVGGERIGVAGVMAPKPDGGAPAATDPRAALAAAVKALDADGAHVKVALLSLPRGEALRLAEAVPGFQVALVANPVERGETNDTPTPPERVGDTLVVESQNHLQSVAVVDLFVRDGKYTFADATGIDAEDRRVSLAARARDLEVAIAHGANEADRAARKRDLDGVNAELAELAKPRALPEGSAFRYELVPIKESLGSDPKSAELLANYYKSVNEHNRELFKDLLPPPVPPGESSYVGVEACSVCHQSEREFWNRTPHHVAYASLASQNKQYNLECVGCHVTGYEAPGGTTVTHVDKLTDVQCEVCHGPGSRHIGSPDDQALVSIPERSLCAGKCHHPPHVHPDWSADAVWSVIVGPGHQLTPAAKKGG
ncbi:MAG TPA: multiheme c-type cytochrome [Polyangiaceae bacterium]|nr:multiheme c-type cytochrome [Polyangiaceae bacterium]